MHTENVSVWHPDVTVFNVYDQSGEILFEVSIFCHDAKMI